MRTLLYINDTICSSLKQLREIVSKNLIPNTPVYEDLLTLQRDGELAQWLAEGCSKEIELSKKLNDLPVDIPNSELVNKIRQIFVDDAQEVRKPHFSTYIELQQIRCMANDEILNFEELSTHRFLGIITGVPQNCEAKFLIDFKVIKTDNESFDIKLLGDYKISLIDKNVGEIVTIETDPCNLTNRTTYSLFVDNVNLAEITINPSELFIKVNDIEINMVFVEGGTFAMGATPEQGSEASDDEKPVHLVTLSDFYIGRYEVTQDEWLSVMDYNPSCFKGNKRPVENIEWDKGQEFIRKLNALTGKNFRLPTEAEWEYAARGGNRSQGYKYAGSNIIDDVAWINDVSTHPVGQKQPNELGLYDMSGNVYEWCQDWWGYYNDIPQINPTGAKSGDSRVCRGGCWYGHYNSGYGTVICRSSNRCYSNSDNWINYIGIRLVL